MSSRFTVALDAMGGDSAPDMVVDGVALACERYPDMDVLLFGDEARIMPLVAKHPEFGDRVRVRCHVTCRIVPLIRLG